MNFLSKNVAKLPEIADDEQLVAYAVDPQIRKIAGSGVNVAMLMIVIVMPMVIGVVSQLSPGPHHIPINWSLLQGRLFNIAIWGLYPLIVAKNAFSVPTYIQISPRGFRLHWLSKKCMSSPWINWSQVKSVRTGMYKSRGYNRAAVMSKRRLHGQVKFFSKDLWLPSRGRIDMIEIDYSLAPLSRANFLFNMIAFACDLNFKARKLQIARELLERDDEAALVSALQEYIPGCLPDMQVTQRIDESSVPEYTTLWLDQLQSNANEKKTLAPNTVLSGPDKKYEIVERLGSGGQAVTYRAQVKSISGAVKSAAVLKEFVLPVSGGLEIVDKTIQNIRKEYELISSLDSEQIVKCNDFFVSGKRAYVSMDVVEGTTLRSYVLERGKLSEDEMTPLALQMCSILTYLHTREPAIIHRDFTPHNLMITPEGKLVLIDFNVARRLESETATTTAVGRHCYIPVEQFQGHATTKSDLYALGCTLFFLMTGQEPEPITPSDVNAHGASVSNFINQLVLRTTAKKQADRFNTAEEIAQEIRQKHSVKIENENDVHARPTRFSGRNENGLHNRS